MSKQPEHREIEPDAPPDADPLAEEQAAAAAAEAGAIGGPAPESDVDPAERPLAEGGGGVAEGFEQAEDELVRHASHDEAAGQPGDDAFSPERESDRSSAVYGEPDEVDATEVVRDPREDEEDPGAGPGLAPDR